MRAPPAADVLDALSVEVVLLDAHGRILSCNRAWRAFAAENGLVLEAEAWTGLDYLGVSSGPEGGDAARIGIRDVLAGRRPRFDLEYPCHGPTQQRWFEMTATRVEGDGGPWVVVSHVNITARHEVERLRRRQWEDAQTLQAEAERVRFMRSVVNELAHELSTPMTSLLLRVKALEGNLPQRDRDAVVAPIDRLRRVVRGLSAIGASLDKPVQADLVDLQELRPTLSELEPECNRRGLNVKVELPQACVRTDRRLLHELVAALATSALAACPSGGQVQWTAAPSGPSARVVVVADRVGPMSGSDQDLWLLSARALARRAGLSLQEHSEGRHTRYELKIPLAVPQAPSTAAA